jgi:hypothetical protein
MVRVVPYDLSFHWIQSFVDESLPSPCAIWATELDSLRGIDGQWPKGKAPCFKIFVHGERVQMYYCGA